MELAVNLPEFRLRYYEDGVQRDSAKIACGKHVSPVIEVQQNEITYRPAFIPTEDEKHMKRPLRPAPPERTNAPQKPRNPLGRRRIVVDGPFRLHGTAWPESMEHNASGGCLRVDNTPDERITDTMVLHGTGHRAEDRPGWSHTYRLPVRFTIRVYYRLWNDLQATDSTLLFRAWPDVHHRLTGRKPRKCPVHDDVKGNAYKLEHLLSDLSQMGLTLKPGFTPQSAPVQKLWATMRAALEKNRKKGAMLSVPLPRNVFERRPGNAQYSSSALYQH